MICWSLVTIGDGVIVDPEAEAGDLNDMPPPDTAGNVTLGTTVTDAAVAYIDVLIGNATGTISVDTAAAVVMTEEDVVVDDVVDDNDTVVKPTVAKHTD